MCNVLYYIIKKNQINLNEGSFNITTIVLNEGSFNITTIVHNFEKTLSSENVPG